jgi:LPS-assembly protein
MTHRNRLIITALMLCHLVLACRAFTSQFPPVNSGLDAAPADGEEVTIRSRVQEKNGDVYKLSGEAEIDYRAYILKADEITYNAATGDVSATGRVLLEGGANDEHLEAARADYNVKTESGRFYDVTGTVGARVRGKNVVLTSSNPFIFQGKLVEKQGRDRFIVSHGRVTSCQLPHPKWTFNAEKVDVRVGENAKMYHSSFWLFGVPLFYFPYVQHPVQGFGRESGFLLPTIGQSSRKGTILGESFYWAINRSMDATIGAEYYSQRGWAQHGNFRARPSENSYIDFSYLGVLDRGFGPDKVDQGGQDATLNAELALPYGFRGVASLEYLSSFIFRLAFSDTFSQAVNSEVKSVAFVTRSYDGFSLNSMASRYQNFQSTVRGDEIKILHLPTVEANSVERRLAGSPITWSFDASAEGVSRSEPSFSTANLVGRIDLHPRAALPLFLRGWSLRPEFALRDTFYTQRLADSGVSTVLVDDPTNRRALEYSLEVRPPELSRIFERKMFGRQLKHTIEPQFTYRIVTGVRNAAEIIRFDARDILSNTNEVEYSVTNRLFAKHSGAVTGCAGEGELQPTKAASIVRMPSLLTQQAPEQVTPPCGELSNTREVFSWEVRQKYFIDPRFGGSLVAGIRNVFTTTSELTGIAFLTEPRNWSPVVSRLRMSPSINTDVSWHFDYDTLHGRINASTLLADYKFRNFFLGGSHAFLNAPGEVLVAGGTVAELERFNQFRVLAGYGHPNKRGVSVATNVGFDTNLSFLQYGAVQTTYNWDCCGFSVEYRRLALGAVRNENQFRFALTLANIGTFGNLRRQERLF